MRRSEPYRFDLIRSLAATRRSFMTGRLPNHVGTQNDLQNATIDPRFVTIQEKLRGSGYKTGMAGKW